MRRRSTAWWVVFIVVPILAGLVAIAPALTGPGLPIESNDETAHTFIDLPLVHNALRSGTLLEINLGANFGTPLLGDPVVCPFAPHAITYALFDPAPAMLINKFILAALSMVVLTTFFSGYFPLGVASICAALAFSSPAFLYSFHNHPHQGLLFYFPSLLLALRGFVRAPGRARAGVLAVAALGCALGVGAHDVMLAAIFAAGFLVLTPAAGFRARWQAALVCGLAVAGLAPHFLEFFRLALASARRGLDYQHLFAVAPADLLSALFLAKRSQFERGDAIHYGVPVALLVLAGVWLARSRAPEALRRITWTLGVAAFVAILAGLLRPNLVASIPLVGAISLSRTLWFADIFLMLSVGVALTALFEVRALRPHLWFAYLVVILAISPRAGIAWWQLSKFHAVAEDLRFTPRQFLGLLAPGTRLATDLDPMFGNADTKAIPYGVLASTGRSIIMNGRFRDRLASEQLIVPGWFGMTYAFAPVSPERLAPYGVRYFITRARAAELSAAGWRQIGHQGDLDLFISPLPVTPVYVDDATPLFLDPVRIRDGSVEVQLPAGGARTVVATFADIGGWKAEFDGTSLPVTSRHGLIAAGVTGGGRLRFVYAPYSTMTIVVVALAAWFTLALFVVRAYR